MKFYNVNNNKKNIQTTRVEKNSIYTLKRYFISYNNIVCLFSNFDFDEVTSIYKKFLLGIKIYFDIRIRF